jgi:tetratricopeptide (TPR) repeat protein
VTHPTDTDLASLFDAVSRLRGPFLHVTRCTRCAELAAATFAFGDESPSPPPNGRRPAADYDPAFRRTRAAVQTAARNLKVQAEQADRLLAELLAAPSPDRPALLRATARFRSYPLALRLLGEARSRTSQREELAGLAVLLLDWWERPRQEVLDLRAEARTELADALRLSGHGEQAERQLVQAATDLRQATDPLPRAAFCRAMGSMRCEQGRFDEAFALLDRAAELYEDAEHEQGQADSCVLAGSWALELGDPRRAVARFAAALALEQIALADRHKAVRGLALALVMDGQAEQALEALGRWRGRFGPETFEGLDLASLEGRIALRRGRPRLAKEALTGAFAGLLQLGHKEEARDAGVALLRAVVALGSRPPAKQVQELAASLLPLATPPFRDLRRTLGRLKSSGVLKPEDLHALDQFLEGNDEA